MGDTREEVVLDLVVDAAQKMADERIVGREVS